MAAWLVSGATLDAEMRGRLIGGQAVGAQRHGIVGDRFRVHIAVRVEGAPIDVELIGRLAVVGRGLVIGFWHGVSLAIPHIDS